MRCLVQTVVSLFCINPSKPIIIAATSSWSAYARKSFWKSTICAATNGKGARSYYQESNSWREKVCFNWVWRGPLQSLERSNRIVQTWNWGSCAGKNLIDTEHTEGLTALTKWINIICSMMHPLNTHLQVLSSKQNIQVMVSRICLPWFTISVKAQQSCPLFKKTYFLIEMVQVASKNTKPTFSRIVHNQGNRPNWCYL